MANVVAYVITNWQNLPTKSTPIDRTNLLHLEQGVKNVTDFVNTLNSNNGAYLYLCQTPFTSALKTKLDGIAENANNYTLPTASTSTKGGVKIDGVTITIDANGVISAAAASIPDLVDLSDVDVSQLADGQILKWDATNGKWVNAAESGGTTISELNDVGDVNITNPSDGDGLVYDATNDEWVNGSVASAVTQLTDVELTQLADGQSLIWDATNSKWINSDLPTELSYADTLEVLGEPYEEVPEQSGYKRELLWGNSTIAYPSTQPSTATLAHDIKDYDDIEIISGFLSSNIEVLSCQRVPAAILDTLTSPSGNNGKLFYLLVGPSVAETYRVYKGSADNILAFYYGSSVGIYQIYGIKY